MNYKKRLYWAILPVVITPIILSSVPFNERTHDKVSFSNINTTLVAENNSEVTNETKVRPGRELIYSENILPGSKQYEMDYTANIGNASFVGLELLNDYFEKNYREIFTSIPGWTKENKIELVMIKSGINSGTNARVTFQGWDRDGQLTNITKDFKIIFAQPSIDKIVIKIKSLLETYRNNWPTSWSETVINQFFTQLTQDISSVIAFNPDSFPTVINDANIQDLDNPPIKYDRNKFQFSNSKINIEANAISLIPQKYDYPDSYVKSINISVPLSATKPAVQSFLEKNGWIIVVLPVGVCTFIVFLIFALFYSRTKTKKLEQVDKTWGFY